MTCVLLANCLAASGVRVDAGMARSNPAALALSGVIGQGLEGHPLPEMPTEPLLDKYLENATRYISNDKVVQKETETERRGEEEGGGGGEDTPHKSHHNWRNADLTLTESGQASAYSWEEENGVMDISVEADVQRMFDKISGALYEGRSTGIPETDQECQQWSSTFPHLQLHGEHLLDSLEDGTDLFPPPFSPSSVSEEPISTGLTVVGRAVQPVALPHQPEYEYLQEELIASDGMVEEYFAFDNNSEDPAKSRRRSRMRRHHELPPVTPRACLNDAVCSLAFDQIWNEVIAVLQPLLARVSKEASREHSSISSPEGSPPLGIGILQHQPYILRGLRDPPTLMKAPGQSGSQYLRFKHSTVAPPPPITLPQIPSKPTGLTGVMRIQSLSLQQRAPNNAPPGDFSREGTPLPPPSIGCPESSLFGARPGRTTPLPPRISDHQLPPTPGNRLLSSRATSRRTLKPLERTKTAVVGSRDVGIQARGYRFSANPSTTGFSSPPSTPWVRHTHLPPLEPVASTQSTQLMGSPPLTRSKNRVSFSSRVSDGLDPRRGYVYGAGAGVSSSTARLEYRPSTSSSFRGEAGTGKGMARKMSEHSLPYVPMKVVGHSIAEDEAEVEGEENAHFTVTGTSGFLQAKSRSSKTSKPKGYAR